VSIAGFNVTREDGIVTGFVVVFVIDDNGVVVVGSEDVVDDDGVLVFNVMDETAVMSLDCGISSSVSIAGFSATREDVVVTDFSFLVILGCPIESKSDIFIFSSIILYIINIIYILVARYLYF